MMIVWLFLKDFRATLIALLAIPVSIVVTFAVFPLAGFTINTLTLFALILAIGLVVDDAIVVIEIVEKLTRPYDALAYCIIQISTVSIAGDNVDQKIPMGNKLAENDFYIGQNVTSNKSLGMTLQTTEILMSVSWLQLIADRGDEMLLGENLDENHGNSEYTSRAKLQEAVFIVQSSSTNSTANFPYLHNLLDTAENFVGTFLRN